MADYNYHIIRNLWALAFSFCALAVSTAHGAQSVNLAWDPSPDPEIAGHRVYYGTASGNLSQMLESGTPTTATVTGLSEGTTYFFAVTAYNFAGLESAYSNEVSYTVPGAPTMGSVQVTISPAAAVSAGGAWRVDGGADQNSGATVGNLSAGNHVVSFKSATGYSTPGDQTVTVNGGQTASAQGVYVGVAQTGSLQVTIGPVGAIIAGAQWSVDGGPYKSSGATVSNLSTGSHVASFKTVAGYTTPANQTVTIIAGQTTSASGAYATATQTGALQVIINPVGAISAGAQWRVDGGAFQNSSATMGGLSIGSHVISFNTVTGYTTPADQTVTVTANQTLIVAGTYANQTQTGALKVVVGPAGALGAGAQWRVDGGALQNSGAIVTNLSTGTHTISFKSITGYITPVTKTVSVVANQTKFFPGIYRPLSEGLFNEQLTFDDNQVPEGWTLVNESDNDNASVTDRHFETRPADTRAGLIKAKTFPLSASRLKMEYKANVTSNYAEQATQIHLVMADDSVFLTSLAKADAGSQQIVVSAGTSESNELNRTFPLVTGTYRVLAEFEDGQIRYRVTKEGATTPLLDEVVAVPNLQIHQLQFIRLFACTGRGEASWIDDVNIQALAPGVKDFDRDGNADIIWQDKVTGQRGIWLMNGTSQTGVVFLPTVPIEWDIAGTGDFNADGQTDIIWQNNVTGQRGIWLMNGTSQIGVVFLPTVPIEWDIAGTGDFNADGQTDIIWQNRVTGERGLWFMNGTTYIGERFLPTVPLAWEIAGTGDFNGDSQPDILWQNTITGQRVIWLMDGSTFLADNLLPTIATEWEIRNK